MKGIGKIVNSSLGELIFSLISGIAYFIIIMGFVVNNTQAGGLMLSFFFLPAIVCGVALILIKAIRRLKDEESFGKINAVVYAHIALLIVSLVFLVDLLK